RLHWWSYLRPCAGLPSARNQLRFNAYRLVRFFCSMGAGSFLRSVAILFGVFGRGSDAACGGLERAKLSCADAFLVQPVLRYFWCRSDTSTSRRGHSSAAFPRRTLGRAI